MKVSTINIFLFSFLVSGCGAGSGPYSSEEEVISALNKYMKKECQCGEARYRYFNFGQDSNIFGCDGSGENVYHVLVRYEYTPVSFKTTEAVSLHAQLENCRSMD